MITEYYKDFYGFTYCLIVNTDGRANLSVRFPRGGLYHAKTYGTRKGARIAMERISEGTARPTGRKEC